MPPAEAGDVVCPSQRAVTTARFLPILTAKACPMIIRPATLDDLPEIAQRLIRHYEGRATPEQIMKGAKWMCWAIGSRERLVLIGPNAFGVASTGMFYGCEARAQVDILCCRPSAGGSWEALSMVRKMVAWARRRGFPMMRLDSDTGIDFAPFGKRLGAEPVTVTKYEIPTEIADGRTGRSGT